MSAIKAKEISKDLYGSSIMSFFERTKGYKTLIEGKINNVTDEVFKAYEDIQARRKLTRF